MSKLPARCELKYSDNPFLEIAGCESESAEFTTAPRLIGADHGPHLDSSSFLAASDWSALDSLTRGPVGLLWDLSSTQPVATVETANKKIRNADRIHPPRLRDCASRLTRGSIADPSATRYVRERAERRRVLSRRCDAIRHGTRDVLLGDHSRRGTAW